MQFTRRFAATAARAASLSSLTLAAVALLLSGSVVLAEAAKKPVKEESSFGALRSVDPG